MSLTAPDPTGGMGGGGAMPGAVGGAGGGQGVQIIQQIQDLLMQLGQTESDPAVQRFVQEISKPMDMLMQVVGGNDTQNMTSGLSNPSGPDDGSGGLGGGLPPEAPSGGGGGGNPKSFKGASKAAADQKKKTGSYSKGSKGS